MTTNEDHFKAVNESTLYGNYNTGQAIDPFHRRLDERKQQFAKMKKYAGDDWKNNWQGQVDYALSEDATKKYLSQDFSCSLSLLYLVVKYQSLEQMEQIMNWY